jgi:hypothetical protein
VKSKREYKHYLLRRTKINTTHKKFKVDIRPNRLTTEVGRKSTTKCIINMETPISVARKAQQFPLISKHLMLAETGNALTNFKRI